MSYYEVMSAARANFGADELVLEQQLQGQNVRLLVPRIDSNEDKLRRSQALIAAGEALQGKNQSPQDQLAREALIASEKRTWIANWTLLDLQGGNVVSVREVDDLYMMMDGADSSLVQLLNRALMVERAITGEG